MPIPPVPPGLSPTSAGIWRELTGTHTFEARELVTFERALRWFDRSEQWLAEAAGAEGRERAQLVKQSLDASTAGLRFWKTLRFVDGLPRRVGRPSDDAWSPQRKRQAAMRQVK